MKPTRPDYSFESMLLSTVAGLGILSAVGFLWGIGLPGWLIGLVAIVIAMLLNRALDLRLRLVDARHRARSGRRQ